MDLKLLFLIPVFDDDPLPLINKILSQYPTSNIILVDDGFNVREDIRYRVLKNEENIGLARSLVKGYRTALSYEFDYLIRIDPDEEYPLKAVSHVFKMSQQNFFDLAICGYSRSIRGNGLIDAVFNKIFGFFEGLVFLGRPLPQHSPALLVFSRRFLEGSIDMLSTLVQDNRKRWGLDLDILTLIKRNHRIILVNEANKEWRERRDIKKIVAQAKESVSIMYRHIKGNLARKFNYQKRGT